MQRRGREFCRVPAPVRPSGKADGARGNGASVFCSCETARGRSSFEFWFWEAAAKIDDEATGVASGDVGSTSQVKDVCIHHLPQQRKLNIRSSSAKENLAVEAAVRSVLIWGSSTPAVSMIALSQQSSCRSFHDHAGSIKIWQFTTLFIAVVVSSHLTPCVVGSSAGHRAAPTAHGRAGCFRSLGALITLKMRHIAGC